MTWSVHCSRKRDPLYGAENVNYHQWDIWACSPAKCLDSSCLVGDVGSPVTTLFSPAYLNCSSVYFGMLFTFINIHYSLGSFDAQLARRNNLHGLCSAVLFLGGLALWSCSPTTRVILIVTGEEFFTPIWSDCWLCWHSSSCHYVLSSSSVLKVNLLWFFQVTYLKIQAVYSIKITRHADLMWVGQLSHNVESNSVRIQVILQSRKLGGKFESWVILVHPHQHELTCHTSCWKQRLYKLTKGWTVGKHISSKEW